MAIDTDDKASDTLIDAIADGDRVIGSPPDFYFEIRRYPSGPRGPILEFRGSISEEALVNCQLDPIDHQILSLPMTKAADILQAIELIFRRCSRGHRAAQT